MLYLLIFLLADISNLFVLNWLYHSVSYTVSAKSSKITSVQINAYTFDTTYGAVGQANTAWVNCLINRESTSTHSAMLVNIRENNTTDVSAYRGIIWGNG